MPIDNRKKKEELKEIVNEAIVEPVEEVKVEEPVESLEEKPDEISKPEEKTEEVVEEPKPEEPKEVKPLPDYKERYQESTKEALLLNSKNKRLVETVEEANNLPEPTEDELVAFARSKGSNYDDLDDFSKGVLKETLFNKKKFEKINEIVKETRDIDAWVDKIETFVNAPETIANPEYAPIIENAEDFQKFANRKEHRGVEIGMLAAAFMYGLSTKPIRRSPKGSMLLSGGSGGGREEKPAGITDAEAANIRLSNPKEYRRLIKSGKIKIEI